MKLDGGCVAKMPMRQKIFYFGLKLHGFMRVFIKNGYII
jgi:hypothetical protein